MSDLYTSYETSLALRDAGASQGDGSNHHWRVPGEFDAPPFAPWLGTYRSRTADVRAFRADEIVEAIRGRIDMITPFRSGRWAVRIKPDDVPPGQVWVDDYFGDSLVEALAKAWLAVLKDVKRG